MQKKKYFFSLAVFVIMLMGVFGGGIVNAYPDCCYFNNQCHSAETAGDCVAAGVCQKCTEYTRGTQEGCCDGNLSVCSGYGSPIDKECATAEKWCCEDKCTDVFPGGSCSSGKPTEKPCNQISKCGGTKGGCCVDESKTPNECPGVPDADGKCAVGKKKDNDCSSYCTSSKCCVDGSGSTATCDSPKTDGTCAKGSIKEGACTTYCTGSNSGTSSTSASFVNPLNFNSIEGVLTGLLTALKGFVVTLAIIFIVLGGILYMMSAGDPTMLKRAKDCWTGAVIGLAIVIAAPTFLAQVQEILGGNLPGSELQGAPTIKDIATRVLSMLLSIVGIIAIISLVIAGSMYMTAYGDDERIKTAKKMGTYAIIGIIVALGSLVAVEQIKILITG
ncbi:MAG: pilin [Candidatus Moraniibacteriota bacterium]